MISQEKNLLRKKYRDIRKNITDRSERESIICRTFLESDLYKSAESLFLYSAIGTEVNVDSVFTAALSDGKKVAFPLCLDGEGNMEFYFVSGTTDMKNGMYSISEPVPEKCRKAYSAEKSVCLVPGLSFDKNGGRLGYGKGYYDRFLAGFTGESVGICFEDCVSDSLRLNQFDEKVNYLITDKTIYIFKLKEE